MKKETQLKVNDVFSFRYNESESKKMFEPYHCFDGTLIVKETSNGELLLQDTYWGSCSDSRVFAIDQANEKGELTFVCNLNEVQEIKEYEQEYYADEDLFILRIHAGYRNKFLLKKDAIRSKDKMIESLNKKLSEAEYDKNKAERNIAKYTRKIEQVNSGDLSVYL